MILVAYIGLTLYIHDDKSGKTLDHLWFMISVYVLTDFGPRCAPKSLTFSESFTLSTLVTIYGSYSLKQITRPVMSSVGNPLLNAAMFAPWVSIVVFLALMYALSFILRPSTAFALSFLPTMLLLAAFYL